MEIQAQPMAGLGLNQLAILLNKRPMTRNSFGSSQITSARNRTNPDRNKIG